ncbi:hypothetical protein BA723_06930 [Helicobacter sp. CLO-3]|uniref:flagellar hook-length control protein FliK n=1 Tax=Helicobacter sp. CLO-3 TaxID=211 RepID=UPI0008055EAB|nr:flagellar hook-length control protein FliK [Helicobacter sp. CLO-3]OBV29098.1 hypothetical protein BA723_06930 [Helicobacter sp. CLO-3]
MSEQISNIKELKKPALHIDAPSSKSPKIAQNGADSGADFKSVLEKSLQSQNSANTDSSAPFGTSKNTALAESSTKGLASKIPSQNPANAAKTLLQGEAMPKNALNNALFSQDTASAPNASQSANATQSALDKIKANEKSAQNLASLDAENPKQGIKNLNDMAKAKPQDTFLSKIAANAAALESAEAESTAPNSANAQEKGAKSGLDSTLAKSDLSKSGLSKSSTPNQANAKSLSENPKSPSTASAQTLSQNSQNADKIDALDSDMFGALAQGMGAQALASTSTNNANSLSAQALGKGSQAFSQSSAQNKPLASMPSGANSTQTLGGVVQKARDLDLNPSNVKMEIDGDEFKNALSNRIPNATRSPIANQDGIKQFFDKQDDQALRPFFYMLQTIDARQAALRRAGNANKVEYVMEGKSERVAVINRGKNLPKNIVDSRLKNERQEKVFEQIQKDLISGKALDLEEIKANLFSSDVEIESSVQTFRASTNPNATQKGAVSLAAAGASLARGANAESARNAKEGEESSKGGKSRASALSLDSSDTKARASSGANANTNGGANSNANANASANMSAQLGEWGAESSIDESSFLSALEQEKDAKAMTQAQNASPKEAESKAKAPEAKLAASAALGANAIKSDAKPLSSNVRETINAFVNQFDQEVKKFKPPMNRISMELSPKELGNIELTITQRGNNLHVSIVSNPQALNLFAQNQTELRNALNASGFEGVDLSFSSDSGSNGGNGANGENSQNPQGHQSYEGALASAQDSTNNISMMEITLPLYA